MRLRVLTQGCAQATWFKDTVMVFDRFQQSSFRELSDLPLINTSALSPSESTKLHYSAVAESGLCRASLIVESEVRCVFDQAHDLMPS